MFEGQNRIHLEIKQLNRQLDMILDEQRRYVSSLTEEISRRGAGTPGQPGQVRSQAVVTARGESDQCCAPCVQWMPTACSCLPPGLPTGTGHCCEDPAGDFETSE